MNTLLYRTLADEPDNEKIIRGLQDYVSAQQAFVWEAGKVMESGNILCDIVDDWSGIK
jgi:hypothetical protein